MHRLSVALAGLLLASMAPCRAETSAVSPAGFVVTHRLALRATPAQVFAAIGQIDRWWNGAHSYSGDARNLSLELRAGGCFCERWVGNSVQHGTVLMVMADSAVRLQASLGPLQEMAVQGVLTIGTARSEGRTTLTFSYRVNGQPGSGLDTLAGPVDGVIGEQAQRLARYVETGSP